MFCNSNRDRPGRTKLAPSVDSKAARQADSSLDAGGKCIGLGNREREREGREARGPTAGRRDPVVGVEILDNIGRKMAE